MVSTAPTVRVSSRATPRGRGEKGTVRFSESCGGHLHRAFGVSMKGFHTFHTGFIPASYLEFWLPPEAEPDGRPGLSASTQLLLERAWNKTFLGQLVGE